VSTRAVVLGDVDRLAARNHGVITKDQAVRVGLSRSQVQRLIDDRRWTRAVPGVYLVAAAPATFRQTALAACRVAGRDAVASHLTAAALLGLAPPPLVPHITVPKTKSARTRIAVVHRSNVSELDRTSVGVIPCTSAARLIIDIAPLVPFVDLCGVVDTALARRRCSVSDVLGAMRRAGKGRHGIASVMAAIGPWMSSVRPGSPAEVRLLRRLDDWGVPSPQLQWEVRGEGRLAVLDLAWPEHRVGLEYDGALAHTPRELERDVERDEWLRGRGWWIGRVDRRDLRPSATRLRDELVPRLRRFAA
jgi:hypothetical protein